MTHGSVFSGIGGPEVAAAMLGWENLFHCEINDFGRKVLEYWFPKSKSYEDITTTDFSEWRGKIDVLTGGFPCQPFSYAGQRRGSDDDRYLWPFMFKCIDQIRPNWVVAENVAGITTMVEQGEISAMGGQTTIFEEVDNIHRFRMQSAFTIERICNNLESNGYSVQPVLIPACAVGAPHRRDRVFIIGRRNMCGTLSNSKSNGRRCLQKIRREKQKDSKTKRLQFNTNRPCICEFAADTEKLLLNGCEFGNGSYDSKKSQSEFRGCDCKETERKFTSDAAGIGRREVHKYFQQKLADGAKPVSNGRERFTSDTLEQCGERLQSGQCEYCESKQIKFGRGDSENVNEEGSVRWDSFPTVSPVHRGNDGIPFDVDRLAIPFSKWRTESLKAYGNAIVPQVMYEIFRAIEITEKSI